MKAVGCDVGPCTEAAVGRAFLTEYENGRSAYGCLEHIDATVVAFQNGAWRGALLNVRHLDVGRSRHALDRLHFAAVLDPDERWAEPGPWTAAEALSAAERRGWFVTDSCQVCPGWHSLEALEALDAKVARRAAMA